MSEDAHVCLRVYLLKTCMYTCVNMQLRAGNPPPAQWWEHELTPSVVGTDPPLGLIGVEEKH